MIKMILSNLILGSIFLIVISLIDIVTFKDEDKGYIPSFVTTLFLIFAFILNSPVALLTGVVAGLIGLLMTDLEFWKGIADFKVFVASGMLFSSITGVAIFGGVLALLGTIVKWFIAYKNNDLNKVFPLIPVMFVAWMMSYLFFGWFF